MPSPTDQDRQIPMFVGILLGLTVSALGLSVDAVDSWVDDRSFLPEWSGVVVAVALVVYGLVWAARNRSRLAATMVVALVPMLVGTNATRLIDPNPPWAETLRGVGMALGFGAIITVGLVAGRRLRELEGLFFSQASSIAFFVTMVTAAVYGIADSFLGAPRLSFLWLPAFGLVSWIVAWSMAESRYS